MGVADRRVDRSYRGLPAHKRGGEYARAIASLPRLNARIRRCVRRAFILSDGEPITIGHVLPRAYPRLRKYLHWHRWSCRRALLQEAQVIARNRFGRGRPNLWALKS